jgi:Xaa-Pro aminopeptidase
MRQGARSPAYPPIVGAGANSCILHYTENTSELQAGDILLIDAGAEYDCYASDITRSFPISGEFSREQALIYELVLAAQKAAIAQVKPGRHWNDPHEAAIAVITDGLIELGILRGTRKKLLSDEAFTRYYMHRTGHWLGMDVHDVGEYKLDGEWRTLEPGMILTIEPGLYFQPARGLAKKWWNIGIRIEDDVLVTRTGHDVLSRHIPKELAEIERLMA